MKQTRKKTKKLVTNLDLTQSKNSESYILIAGRTGSGKTNMLIAYANMYPKTTLFYSQESSKKTLRKKGLKSKIKVVYEDTFSFDEIYKYDTICLDYIQLFDKEYIENLIKRLMQINIRIIAVSYMKPKNYDINNIFQTTRNTNF
jgi:thymidine kinase